jgi:hypothetical protein
LEIKMLRTLAAALAFSLVSSVASATVVGLTGNVAEIPAPSSVTNAVPNSDATAYVFEESTLWLTSDLVTSTGIIAAGQWVTSYMLFLNQAPGAPNNVSAAGTVTFSDAILGLMTSTALVNGSHGLLGAPGTTYNLPNSNTGLESGDSLTFSLDTATFRFTVTQPGDWTRVITVATIPLPAGGLLLLGGLAGLAALRRRRTLA